MVDNLSPVVVPRRDFDRLFALTKASAGRNAPETLRALMDKLDIAEDAFADEALEKTITMNSRARIRDDEKSTCFTVTLVYPGLEDVSAGRISVLSPIGIALLGISEGCSVRYVTPAGQERSLTVLKILHQPDGQG